MKPLKGDSNCDRISVVLGVARPALKPKSSPRRGRGLDASNDRGLPEGSGEVFFLDILSHRMSEMAMFQQLRRVQLAFKDGWLLDICGGGI